MRGVTQFCGVSRGEALFCLEFPGVGKVKNLKIPGYFQKSMFSTPPFALFLE